MTGREPGALRGRIWVAGDVDQWPEDMIAAMERGEDDLSGGPRVDAARDGDGVMSNEIEDPRIPRPPTKEELDEISEAQGMITDEWAPAPGPGEGSGTAPDDQVGPENQSSPGR